MADNFRRGSDPDRHMPCLGAAYECGIFRARLKRTIACIGKRLHEADILFAPVDDDRFGDLFAYLHAADIVYRAAENNITIATASTNSPTFLVRRDGYVVTRPLPLWSHETYINEVYQ